MRQSYTPFYSTEKPEKLVLSLVGKDRVGIVRDFSKFLTNNGGNVEESRMSRLGGEFAMIILVSLKNTNADQFTKVLQNSFPGFHIHSSITEESVTERPFNSKPYDIWVEGPDTTGIVAAVTDTLANYDIAIEALETETVAAPFAGYTSFHMNLKVDISDDSIQKVKKSLEEVEAKFGLEIDLEEEKPDV
ncbi:hypothetical protein HK096_011385 [Nowakowskiella sp. JEL0078]|nr:hypothetical protein HK096_011385 [Nowakowskiella sp. JEL0078]